MTDATIGTKLFGSWKMYPPLLNFRKEVDSRVSLVAEGVLWITKVAEGLRKY
ncbi:MAG: hypothetical protein ACTS6A_02160 [Candidatus Hodgkinia cicadicola]